MALYRKLLPRETLQEFDWAQVDAWTVSAYERVMRRYLVDRERIPEGRLFECRYEDLDQRPMEVLARLYRSLAIDAFDEAAIVFENYLASLGEFEKNRFDFPADAVATVNRSWRFALEAFDYPAVAPGDQPVGGPRWKSTRCIAT